MKLTGCTLLREIKMTLHTQVGGGYMIYLDVKLTMSGLVMVYIDCKTARLKSKTEEKSLRDL